MQHRSLSGAFMIRRTILSAAAAIALVAMPMAAMAYDAPGYNTTVSDPTPAIGIATSAMAAAAERMVRRIMMAPERIGAAWRCDVRRARHPPVIGKTSPCHEEKGTKVTDLTSNGATACCAAAAGQGATAGSRSTSAECSAR